MNCFGHLDLQNLFMASEAVNKYSKDIRNKKKGTRERLLFLDPCILEMLKSKS